MDLVMYHTGRTSRWTTSVHGQLAVFVGALGATIIVHRQIARYTLQIDRTPHGIIDFELAGSADWAREIVDTWRAANLIENVRPNIAIVDARFIPC